MKVRILFTLLLLVQLPIAHSSFLQADTSNTLFEFTATKKVFSLDEISLIALHNSLDIQIAQFDTYIKRNSLWRAKSIFDTFLTGKTSYARDEKQPTIDFLSKKSTEYNYEAGIESLLPTGTRLNLLAKDIKSKNDSPVSTFNPVHDASVRASITQNVGRNFFGIIDRGTITITKLDIENAEYTSLDSIEQSLFDVQIAYWNLALHTKIYEITQEILKEAQHLHDIYKDKLSIGLVEKADYLAIVANLKQKQNEVRIALLSKETAKNDLLLLLNVSDFSIPLETYDILTQPQESIVLYDAIRTAITHKRTYKKVKNQLKANKVDIIIKRNSLFPEIDIEASFLRNALNKKPKKAWKAVRDSNHPEVFLGLKVRIPIENRAAKADYKDATYQKEQLLLILKKTERQILRDMNNAVKAIHTFHQNVQLNYSLVDIEKQKLEAESKRLRFGRSSSDIIIRYTNDLLQARITLARSCFEYRKNKAQLALLQNTLLSQYWNEESVPEARVS